MMQVIFVFKNNLNGQIINIKGLTMRHAMHAASLKLGVKAVNLIFVGIIELNKAA